MVIGEQFVARVEVVAIGLLVVLALFSQLALLLAAIDVCLFVEFVRFFEFLVAVVYMVGHHNMWCLLVAYSVHLFVEQVMVVGVLAVVGERALLVV